MIRLCSTLIALFTIDCHDIYCVWLCEPSIRLLGARDLTFCWLRLERNIEQVSPLVDNEVYAFQFVFLRC